MIAPRDEAAGASPVDRLVDSWVSVLLDVQGYSPATAKGYRASLLDFMREMDLDDPLRATTPLIDKYIGTRLGLLGRSMNTRRHRLNGLKSFYAYACSRKLMPEDPAKPVKRPDVRRYTVIPVFRGMEIERLVSVDPRLPERGRREPKDFFARRLAATELGDLRDSAIIALMYACGLRAGEVAGLDRDAYDGKSVLVMGKAADEPQPIEVMLRARLILAVYLVKLEASAWSLHPALFPPFFDKSRRSHPGHGLSDDGVARILAARVRRAGIEPKRRRLSPHTLRYSIATHFYELGYQLPDIRRHLRHRAYDTTLTYVNLGPRGLPKRRDFRIHPWILGRAFTAGDPC